MKETILDVLLYLFEHYFYDDPDAANDRESMLNGPIFQGLTQAGFSAVEINKAFDWLDALARQRPQTNVARHTAQPVRVYADVEQARLDTECIGFLMFLEHNGILDGEQRELVLDRVMALDQDEIDLDDLKWVVLMVLFNQPGAEAAFAWMEGQIFQDEPEPLH
jgi:Smg protein